MKDEFFCSFSCDITVIMVVHYIVLINTHTNKMSVRPKDWRIEKRMIRKLKLGGYTVIDHLLFDYGS